MPQRNIPQDELINFIVKVRYYSSQTTDTKRWLGQIRNLANHMYRSYIGYTARGEYRVKAKGEHVFAEDLAQREGEDPFRSIAVENERLAALAGEMEKIKAERAEYERRKREVDRRATEAADEAHAAELRRRAGFDAFDAAGEYEFDEEFDEGDGEQDGALDEDGADADSKTPGD